MTILEQMIVDLENPGFQPVIPAVQNCCCSLGLEIALRKGGRPYRIPKDVWVVVQYKKLNGKGGEYDTMPDGSAAWSVQADRLTVKLAQALFTVPGSVELLVTMHQNQQSIVCFPVTLYVQGCANALLPESTEEYTNVNRGWPGPESAQPGQFLRVATVDDAGRVTALDVADSTAGKSAYEFAVEGGYTGTEEEFAAKLAEEFPEALPNPYGLRIDGTEYDGSEAVEILSPTPDWAVNLGTPGFIQNRTHYSRYDYGRGVSKSRLFDADGYCLITDFPLPIVEGQMWRISIGGRSYYSLAEVDPYDESSVYVGNVIWDYPTMQCPVVLMNSFDTEGAIDMYALDPDLNGTKQSMSIMVYTQETVKKLDEKYVPNMPNPHELIFNGAYDGSYDGTERVRVEIPIPCTTDREVVMSDNLLDKESMTYGYLFYYGEDGQVVGSDGSYEGYYGYVPLRGPGTYRTKLNYWEHMGTGSLIALAKEDESWFQHISGTLTATDNKYAYDFEFVVTQDMIDNGAAKIAFDYAASMADSIMIVKDREYPQEYIPYGPVEITTVLGRKKDNVLCEKSAIFLGDGISAGTSVGEDSAYYGYGWAGLIGEGNWMKWKNYGQDSATAAALTEQAATAMEEYPDADYVLFECGCVDAEQNVALGSISEDYATFDTATFSGALENLLLKLATAYPMARIGFVIPPKLKIQNDYSADGHTYRKYFDQAIAICEKWGVPYLDLWTGCMMNPSLPSGSVFYSGEGTQLTEAGYQKIAPRVEAFMRRL